MTTNLCKFQVIQIVFGSERLLYSPTKSQYKYERGTYNNLLKFAFSRMTMQFPCLVTSLLVVALHYVAPTTHTGRACKAIEKIQLTRTKLKCIGTYCR